MTKEQFKAKLEKAVTWGDAHDLMKETPVEIVKSFVIALEKAKEFIELTMRDDFILNVAKSNLQYR